MVEKNKIVNNETNTFCETYETYETIIREMIRMDMTYTEVAKATGIKYSLLYSRYKILRQNIQSNPTQ